MKRVPRKGMDLPVTVSGLCVSCSDAASKICVKMMKGEPMLTLTTGITICIPVPDLGNALSRFQKAQSAPLGKVEEQEPMRRAPTEIQIDKAREQELVTEAVKAMAPTGSLLQHSSGRSHGNGIKDTQQWMEKVKHGPSKKIADFSESSRKVSSKLQSNGLDTGGIKETSVKLPGVDQSLTTTSPGSVVTSIGFGAADITSCTNSDDLVLPADGSTDGMDLSPADGFASSNDLFGLAPVSDGTVASTGVSTGSVAVASIANGSPRSVGFQSTAGSTSISDSNGFSRFDAHSRMPVQPVSPPQILADEKTDVLPRRTGQRYAKWAILSRSRHDTKDEAENVVAVQNENVDIELKQKEVQNKSTRPSSIDYSPVVQSNDRIPHPVGCATTTCPYRVHSQHREHKIFGYCCGLCAESGEHGPKCEKILAIPGSVKGVEWASRTKLACNTKGCSYLVHSQPMFMGFCCESCSTGEHSKACQKVRTNRFCVTFATAWQDWKDKQ